MTVEDPIEYHLPGIGQTQVNSKAQMTFARGLRAILRQDPDVVMVGEIRDLETAEIAIQAALTGHLVLSTLHTNSALGAIARLRDLGWNPIFSLPASAPCWPSASYAGSVSTARWQRPRMPVPERSWVSEMTRPCSSTPSAATPAPARATGTNGDLRTGQHR